MDEQVITGIIITIIVIMALGGLITYGYFGIHVPLKDFCNKINNSELIEYKQQYCSSGSDYLVKCSDGNIYGVDTTRYCEEWDTWGDCIKQGKTKFKLSHLTYPKC